MGLNLMEEGAISQGMQQLLEAGDTPSSQSVGKPGPQSYNLKELDSVNKLKEQKTNYFLEPPERKIAY